MKQKFISFLLALSLVLTAAYPAFAAEVPADGADLSGAVVILHTNDSHGRMTADENNGQAGFAVVSGIKKAYEAAGAEVLLFDLGDTLHGLPIATVNAGDDVVTVLNAVGYDAMVPGNHDFNYGTDRLKTLSGKMRFPLLSANTINKTTGTALFESSVIIEKGDIKFGVFGLTTPETAYKTNPANVASVTFADPVEYAQAQVDQLMAADVDCIIALGHIGVDASSEVRADLIAGEVEGIDIFIDGHSHTAMVGGKPVDMSIVLAPHGETVIASTGEYIENIGVIVIDDKGIDAGLIPYSPALPVDEEITALLEGIVTAQDTVLAEVVGTTAVELDGARETNRKQETNLGNLAADAFREATGADMAFTNGGGIRASIEIGDITKKDLVTVFPFGNYVVTKNVTGAAILAAMEHGVKDYPELSGGFPQVSGVTFELNEAQPGGSRVQNLTVGGQAVNPEATYLIATNDFIAAGGDGYTMFSDFAIANEFGAMEEILISYIRANPDKVAEVEGRITVVADGAAAVAQEEEVPAEVEEVAPSEEVVEAPVAEVEAAEPEADPVPVEEPAPAPAVVTENPGVYVVVSGDNLWKIAKDLTGSGENWPAIYELNQDIISDPHMIYIGQELVVPQ